MTSPLRWCDYRKMTYDTILEYGLDIDIVSFDGYKIVYYTNKYAFYKCICSTWETVYNAVIYIAQNADRKDFEMPRFMD